VGGGSGHRKGGPARGVEGSSSAGRPSICIPSSNALPRRRALPSLAGAGFLACGAGASAGPGITRPGGVRLVHDFRPEIERCPRAKAIGDRERSSSWLTVTKAGC
jgi:hypothetical protein